MYRTYAPTTDDIDNFRFAASVPVGHLLRGELEFDAGMESGESDDDFPLDA